MLKTMAQPKDFSEGLRRRIYTSWNGCFEPFLNNSMYSSLNCIYIVSSKNCTYIQVVSSLCWGLEEEPNCHTQMRGNSLGCSGTNQEPPRLKSAMKWKLLEQSVTVQWSEFYIHVDWKPSKKASPKPTLSSSIEICSCSHGQAKFYDQKRQRGGFQT